MTVNDTVAWYGIFQVVFADVVEHLAKAMYDLRKEKEQDLTFNTVFEDAFKFKKLMCQFRDELRRFDKVSAQASDSLHIVRAACQTMSEVANWRNERIHCRVKIRRDGGIVLYDSRTGYPLKVNSAQITKYIHRVQRAMVDLEAEIPNLIRELKRSEDFEKLHAKLAESPDAESKMRELFPD